MLFLSKCQNNSLISEINKLKGSTITKPQLEIMLLQNQKNILRYDEDVDKKQKTIEDVMSEIDKEIDAKQK
jgi:hypothetical protein